MKQIFELLKDLECRRFYGDVNIKFRKGQPVHIVESKSILITEERGMENDQDRGERQR